MTPLSAASAPDLPDKTGPSKTALKKQAHDLQALGQALAALPEEQLLALALPETLHDALRELKRIRAHEGRRRQLQYVGKLMRKADVQPLREAVAAARLGPAQDTLALHRIEQWRSELASDDAALTRWLAAHPQSNAQRLSSLIRNAREDALAAPEQRHGRAWRELFRFIKSELNHE
jgi:ribosome-associated protein